MEKRMNWKTGLLLAGLVLVGAGCSGAEDAEPQTVTEDQGEAIEFTLADGAYALDTDASTLAWNAKKVGGAHNGTTGLSSGGLEVVDGIIVGGTFVIDMTSIVNLDLEGDENAALVEHLSSEAFFNVAEFEASIFTITGATENALTGDLTIKGITNEISFAYELAGEGEELMLTAMFPIDRTQWEILFGSESVIDRVESIIIDDEVNYDLELIFSMPTVSNEAVVEGGTANDMNVDGTDEEDGTEDVE